MTRTLERHESGLWLARARIDKYEGDIAPFQREGRAHEFLKRTKPYDVFEEEGNILVTAGITALLQLLGATASPTAFSNANGYLGVGDSNTAASAGQTDLQASSNKLRKAMDSTYPSVSGAVITWKATFASGDANFAWEEWAIFNASSSGTMLNRKVASMGTKASGSSWAFTVTVTLS